MDKKDRKESIWNDLERAFEGRDNIEFDENPNMGVLLLIVVPCLVIFILFILLS